MASFVEQLRARILAYIADYNRSSNRCAGYVRRVTHDEIADAIG
jgi:hypothetical protein